jgi:BetI-type transcriptional repressor, C-terminal
VREATRKAWARWLRLIENEVSAAVEAGDLPADTDAGQVAFELNGIVMGLNNALQLHGDRAAPARARLAIDRVLAPSRPDRSHP